jgi:predicted nuclease of predicted toxin-antitoxin system
VSLLLDNNLSHRLVPLLADTFPGARRVKDYGLQTADDAAIWACAIEHGLSIASKDDDFRQRSLVQGHPPKVVWIRLGNVPTTRILLRLIEARPAITLFLSDKDASFMMIE